MANLEEQNEEDDEVEDFGADDYPEDVEGDDVVVCTQCKATVSALCDMCPKCGHWFMETDRPQMAWNRTEGKGLKVGAIIVVSLIVVMVIAGLVLMLLGRPG